MFTQSCDKWCNLKRFFRTAALPRDRHHAEDSDSAIKDTLNCNNSGESMSVRIYSLLGTALVCAVSCLTAVVAHAQVDANDLVWQNSVAKFDHRRAQILKHVDRTVSEGPFSNNWDSLEHYEIPQWYLDAKFGIFIHWGVYSVPAFRGEWYPRYMYEHGSDQYKHQIELYGPQAKFGYKDFIPMFKGERFDPAQWATLFKESGARYVIPVAEHHDGFQMYRSTLSDWNAVKMGPHRDVLGELRTQILAQGLHFGLSSHRAEHYWFLNGGRDFPSDIDDPKYASFYGPAHKDVMRLKVEAHPDPAFLDDWLARSAELVDEYHPELVYFDWWIETKGFSPHLKSFAAFYYNEATERHQQVVLFRKNAAFPPGTTVLDVERGQLDRIQEEHWQTDTSVSVQSWGYVEGDSYKSPQTLIWDLIDIVSKNGNLLLNVGPKSDGTIPNEAVSILRNMGAWLKVNGAAIYGTRPWKIYGEGPTKVVSGAMKESEEKPFTPEDIRFTTKDGYLYAMELAWPVDNIVHIHSLKSGDGATVKGVQMLGSNESVHWRQDDTGLTFQLNATPEKSYAYAFKIALEGIR
jgi:alpha-L-fucosidase